MKTDRPLILLVEDNPADANLVKEALAEARVECLLSILRDGAQAIQFIERLDAGAAPQPDIVLLDLNLPKVEGAEVLKRLRASPKCAGAKVLIVSSSDAPADRDRAIELGANGYFRKPESWEQFMELGPKILTLLESHSGL
jgi:CheY-like chemotaxis protein